MSVESFDVNQTAGCSDTDALLSDQDQGTYQNSLLKSKDKINVKSLVSEYSQR